MGKTASNRAAAPSKSTSSAGEGTVTTAADNAPSSAGNSRVESSASLAPPAGKAGVGTYSVEDARDIEWDPQGIGDSMAWENEGGLDTSTGRRVSTKEAKGGETRTAGDAEIVAPGDDLETDDIHAGGDESGNADDDVETPGKRQTRDGLTRSQRRAEVLRAIRLEQTRRPLEEEARTATEAAKASKAEADKLNDALARARSGKMSLPERLALIGMTREELTDEVIMSGSDAVGKGDDKGGRKADPEVVALKEAVDALRKKLDDKETNAAEEARRNQANEVRKTARTIIKEGLKEGDKVVIPPTKAPLVLGLNAEDRVVRAAWHTWKVHREKGNVSDYIPAAAEVIEEMLEKEHPDLAEMKRRNREDAAQGEEGEDDAEPVRVAAPVARPSRFPAVGARTTPSRIQPRGRQNFGVTSLDPDERTRQVIKSMGWKTGN